MRGGDVMRFTVVIPGDDFDHRKALVKHFVPAVVEQRAAGEDPVLAKRDLRAEMRKEPRRHRSEIRLAAKPVPIRIIAILH